MLQPPRAKAIALIGKAEFARFLRKPVGLWYEKALLCTFSEEKIKVRAHATFKHFVAHAQVSVDIFWKQTEKKKPKTRCRFARVGGYLYVYCETVKKKKTRSRLPPFATAADPVEPFCAVLPHYLDAKMCLG